MITVVMGGCLAGKSTYVLQEILKGDPHEGIWGEDAMPVTFGPEETVAVGRYHGNGRGCGVDSLKTWPERGIIWMQVASWLKRYHDQFRCVAVEGDAINNRAFLDNLIGLPVHLVYLSRNWSTIQEHARGFKTNWILNSHQRAQQVFNLYREVFSSEILH